MRVLTVFFAAFLCISAEAAERIEFRIPAGFAYTFDNQTDSNSVLDVVADGQTMVLEQSVSTRIAGTVEVLESESGVPSRVRIQFSPESGSRVTSNGATENTPFAVAGRMLIVDVSDEELVAVRDGSGADVELDDETRSVVAEVAIAEQAVLPGRAVSPGDTWVANLARDDRPLTPELALALADFGEQDGRRVARLDADGTLIGSQHGFDMDGRVRGPIVMDLETGLPLSSRLTGSVDVSGAMNQNGTEIAMSGTQQVTISSTNRPAQARRAAAADPDGVRDDGWTEYRHASGAILKHPPAWRVEADAQGVRLMPPDSGAAEMIVASGMASDASSPSADEVASYLDSAMWQMLPGLSRSGPPRPVEAAQGQGAVYSYEGALQDGTPVLCDVYVTLHKGVALSLSAIAPPPTLRSRAATLAKVFASMQMSAPAAAAGASAGSSAGAAGSLANSDDPRLVGMFAGEALAGGAGEGVYINTQLVYVLNADGTVYYGAQSHFSTVERDINGYTKWAATGNTDGSVQSGRWSAKGGFLTVHWDSGRQSYFAYGFEPDGSLVMRNPTTRKLINFYRRVR